MKTCSKCGEEKDVSEFYTRRKKCKVCLIKQNMNYQKTEKGRAVQLQANRKAQHKYNQTEKGKVKRRKQANKPIEKIKNKLRKRLYSFLVIGIDSKRNRALMGCTRDELIAHYESKFKEGMTWENYGEWENDHIKEMSKFDLENEETWKDCMHWSNLQPQWKELNRKNIH